VTSTPASPAPLEAHDPARARVLKAKTNDRVGDVRRHLVALRAAMTPPAGHAPVGLRRSGKALGGG